LGSGGGLHGLAMASPMVGRDLRVYPPADTSSLKPLLQALRQHCPNLLFDSEAPPLDLRKPGLHLALGPQGLRRALAQPAQVPIVSALTSSAVYRRMLGGNPHESGLITAIHAEASPLAQMQVVSALFERKVTVGVLLSDGSAHMERPLRQAAQAQGLDIQILNVAANQDPARALNGLANIQVLMAVPDGALYTPDNLRGVLESTYRRGMPVIGFSQATVAAGTLACAHADLDDATTDLMELLDNLPANPTSLPEARHPRYWRVAINDSVARSLGLVVSERLRTLGSRPGGRSA
jgi:ABC-type uncharacterized transport system substrate-binding protein